jgi:spermidine/putrescine transport system permease protein
MEAASLKTSSSTGSGPLKRASRAVGDKLLPIFAGLAILYMMIPIAVIAIFSFNDPQGRYNFEWVGFTTKHWANAFGIPELTSSLLTSLQLAAIATVISAVLGTMIALALVRYEFYGRKPTNFLIVIPLATPEVVIGAGLLSMFISFSFPLGFGTLLIAHVMFCISFVVVVVRSRLIGFDRSLEEAARDLGATPFQTFRLVTLPLIAPGIVAGALLAFALSIDDFVISNFNSGTTVTFPLYIFGASQRGIPVEVNVIATILMLVAFAAMSLVLWQQHRANKLAKVEAEPDPMLEHPRESRKHAVTKQTP